MQFLSYHTVDELEEIITWTIESISKTWLIHVFQGWGGWFEKCIQHEGNYFE
jgi:hypothetical protein